MNLGEVIEGFDLLDYSGLPISKYGSSNQSEVLVGNKSYNS